MRLSYSWQGTNCFVFVFVSGKRIGPNGMPAIQNGCCFVAPRGSFLPDTLLSAALFCMSILAGAAWLQWPLFWKGPLDYNGCCLVFAELKMDEGWMVMWMSLVVGALVEARQGAMPLFDAINN